MSRQTKYHIGVEIDKLTNSIQNIISGDSFPTDVHPISKADLEIYLRLHVKFPGTKVTRDSYRSSLRQSS